MDEILKSDQILREYSNSNISESRKKEILKIVGCTKEELDKNLWSIVNKNDSINLVKVEKIIKEYGYPGKTLVGEPTNKAVWYVIQHSKKIPEYFELIKLSGEKNEIPMTLVATMEDRMLMYEGKEQIYGTQGAGRMIYDEKGNQVFFNFIWPIQNPAKVNELRKKVGFNGTIEDYAKSLEIPYSLFTMKDFKKLKLVTTFKH
ncbi:DUF6624 domain-containing protein [Flavobacterium sp. H122]|uniref:DUF6624 domain-containing protein n=1 Tax=Flavobacterium sp. H122 TaxID=2529860 RepID=UPI0020BECB9F|nr:DUF6624 domain-containing protein [Flavobacterium sp. H122]